MTANSLFWEAVPERPKIPIDLSSEDSVDCRIIKSNEESGGTVDNCRVKENGSNKRIERPVSDASKYLFKQ